MQFPKNDVESDGSGSLRGQFPNQPAVHLSGIRPAYGIGRSRQNFRGNFINFYKRQICRAGFGEFIADNDALVIRNPFQSLEKIKMARKKFRLEKTGQTNCAGSNQKGNEFERLPVQCSRR